MTEVSRLSPADVADERRRAAPAARRGRTPLPPGNGLPGAVAQPEHAEIFQRWENQLTFDNLRNRNISAWEN